MGRKSKHQKAVNHLIQSVHQHQTVDPKELNSLDISELAKVIVRDMDDSALQQLTPEELKAISKNFIRGTESASEQKDLHVIYSLLINHPDYSMFRLEEAIIAKIQGLNPTQKKELKTEIIKAKEEDFKKQLNNNNNNKDDDANQDGDDDLEDQTLSAKAPSPVTEVVSIIVADEKKSDGAAIIIDNKNNASEHIQVKEGEPAPTKPLDEELVISPEQQELVMQQMQTAKNNLEILQNILDATKQQAESPITNDDDQGEVTTGEPLTENDPGPKDDITENPVFGQDTENSTTDQDKTDADTEDGDADDEKSDTDSCIINEDTDPYKNVNKSFFTSIDNTKEDLTQGKKVHFSDKINEIEDNFNLNNHEDDLPLTLATYHNDRHSEVIIGAIFDYSGGE